MGTNSDRIAFIDALRGFAILGVIVAHSASAAGLEGPLSRLAIFCGQGVQLFFLVSAFTIFTTYSRSIARETHPTLNFFVRRLFRIMPVYWAGIVIYTAVYGTASRGWLPGPDVWDYPFHLTLTNVFLPDGTSSVVPGGWSISVEVLFYLTAPIWFLVVRDLRAAVVFTAVWTVVAIGFMKIAPAVIDISWADPSNRSLFWYRQLPAQLASFGCGMVLYYAITSDAVTSALRSRKVVVGLVVLTLALAALAMEGGRVIPAHLRASFAFMGAALLLSQFPVRPLVNQFTVTIGRVSYSAYLIHFLVIQALLSLVPWPADTAARSGLLAVSAIAVTLPLAWLSWRTYETFWVKVARSVVARIEERRPTRQSDMVRPAGPRSSRDPSHSALP